MWSELPDLNCIGLPAGDIITGWKPVPYNISVRSPFNDNMFSDLSFKYRSAIQRCRCYRRVHAGGRPVPAAKGWGFMLFAKLLPLCCGDEGIEIPAVWRQAPGVHLRGRNDNSGIYVRESGNNLSMSIKPRNRSGDHVVVVVSVECYLVGEISYDDKVATADTRSLRTTTWTTR